MTYTAKCPKCQKEFTGATQLKANQMMRMHMVGAHTKHSRGPRVRMMAKNQTVESLHFCPQCGLDLHKLAVAMVVTSR